jgi:hypothetical protein
MSKYANEHRDALADVQAAGSAVTFTKDTQGTHIPTTGQSGAPTPASISGYAIQTQGNPKQYEAAKLLETESPTLLFVSSIYAVGQAPSLGARVTWGGKQYKVASVNTLQPDGTPILSKVIINR